MSPCRRLAAAAAFLFLAGSPAEGADLFGKTSSSLYHIDTVTGVVTLVGATPFGSGEVGMRFGDRAANGRIHCISNALSSTVSKIYEVDDATGATTQLYALATNALSLVGAAIDPTDGSMYYTVAVGPPSNAELRRVDYTGAVEQNLGLIGTGAFFSGLAFDAAGNLFSIHRSSATLWSVNKANPAASGPVGGGLGAGLDLSTGADINRDPVTGLVWGYEVKNQRLFTVDLGTGAATLHGVALGAHPVLLGIYGDDPCGGGVTSYGSGCAGTGGIVPGLDATSSPPCPDPGATIGLSIHQGLGGATAVLVFGLNQAAIPAGGGCTLNLSPLVGPALTLPLGGVGPGAGSVALNGVLPPSAAGVTLTMQAIVLDPGSPIGASATNGVELAVP